jgi:hypothetical protein
MTAKNNRRCMMRPDFNRDETAANFVLSLVPCRLRRQ